MINMNGSGSDVEHVTGLILCKNVKLAVQFLFREEK